MRNAVRDPFVVVGIVVWEIPMTNDSGSGSTPRRYPRLKPPPMKFRDASDPIYSNPTILGFVRKRSSPDSEIPDKPSSASSEDSVEKED